MNWQLKLPERGNTTSNGTIGECLRDGYEIFMYCHQCDRKAVRLNLVQIAKRHGMGYSSMTPSLTKVVSCSACKEAGRPRKNISFTVHSPNQHSRWPR